MTEAAFERQGERLRAIKPDADFVLVTAAEAFSLNDKPLAQDDVNPEVVWLTADSWQANLQKTLVGVIRRSRPKWVQAHTAGLDDRPMFRSMMANGARVTKNAAQAVPMAEYVMAHALSLILPIDAQREAQAERKWQETFYNEVNRTRWGLIGWGEVGQEIATRALAFGAKVSGFRRTPGPDKVIGQTNALADLPKFLPNLDIVVLALPSTAETRKVANAEFFAAMKTGSILINVARGALIDHEALRAGLEANKPARAVLDVFETEPLPEDSWIWDHPKVRMSAHTSWKGDGNAQRMDDRFVENFRRFVAGESMLNEADPREAGL